MAYHAPMQANAYHAPAPASAGYHAPTVQANAYGAPPSTNPYGSAPPAYAPHPMTAGAPRNSMYPPVPGQPGTHPMTQQQAGMVGSQIFASAMNSGSNPNDRNNDGIHDAHQHPQHGSNPNDRNNDGIHDAHQHPQHVAATTPGAGMMGMQQQQQQQMGMMQQPGRMQQPGMMQQTMGGGMRPASGNVMTATAMPSGGMRPANNGMYGRPANNGMYGAQPAQAQARPGMMQPTPVVSAMPAPGGVPTAMPAPGVSPPGVQYMQVVCPMNKHAGQQMMVNVPGRGQMKVNVPMGTFPGRMFKFGIPAVAHTATVRPQQPQYAAATTRPNSTTGRKQQGVFSRFFG